MALLHGRMKGDEKVEVVRAFKAGEYQLLVATTVVEVGVDVPNATQMFVENAERLGLAQLHQLRGRVGRGREASRCFLLFKPGVRSSRTISPKRAATKPRRFLSGGARSQAKRPWGYSWYVSPGAKFKIADLSEHAHLMPRVLRRCETMMNAAPNSNDGIYLTGLLNTWAASDNARILFRPRLVDPVR